MEFNPIVKEIQKELEARGYTVGPKGCDGKAGKATRLAFLALLSDFDEMRNDLPSPPSNDTDWDDWTNENIDGMEICFYSFSKVVNYGDGNKENPDENVKKLQAMLYWHGLGKYLGTKRIDGVFGEGTRVAVQEYMRGLGLNSPEQERKRYRVIDEYIWNLFNREPYDLSNFNDESMTCNCGSYCNGYPPGHGFSIATKMLLVRAEKEIQNEFGEQYTIKITDAINPHPTDKNGGYRCPVWNSKKGGAKKSRHMYGDAFDGAIFEGDKYLDYKSFNYKRVQQITCKINPYGGCSTKYNGVFHIDSRGHKSHYK